MKMTNPFPFWKRCGLHHKPVLLPTSRYIYRETFASFFPLYFFCFQFLFPVVDQAYKSEHCSRLGTNSLYALCPFSWFKSELNRRMPLLHRGQLWFQDFFFLRSSVCTVSRSLFKCKQVCDSDNCVTCSVQKVSFFFLMFHLFYCIMCSDDTEHMLILEMILNWSLHKLVEPHPCTHFKR